MWKRTEPKTLEEKIYVLQNSIAKSRLLSEYRPNIPITCMITLLRDYIKLKETNFKLD